MPAGRVTSFTQRVISIQARGRIAFMTGRNANGVAGHFGRQMKKERTAKGWTLTELSHRTGVNDAHLGRIEHGNRPPTEAVALKLDEVFPHRRGWFHEFWQELQTWAPPGFRNWPEYEDKATYLGDWWPSLVSGLLQSEEYARALLSVHLGATDEIVNARLKSRMERQRRLFAHEVRMHYLIDELALYRRVGSPEVMAAQMRHLVKLSELPDVTLQVVPAIAHPAAGNGFIITNDATYTEHVRGGMVFTDDETVTAVARLFDSLRAESYRASESLVIIERAESLWTGGQAATPGRTAARASKSRRQKA